MFRDRIQAQYEELSPRFRTLADFILENTLDVGFLTATELARRVGVDPATVVRFSQEMGYSGYRELSREIKHYINQQLALRYKKGAPGTEGLPGQVAIMADEISDRTLDIKADAKQIAEVAEKLHAAKRIFITATTKSMGIAALWSTYLNILGFQTQVVDSNPAEAAILLQKIQAEDVLLAISVGLGPGAAVGHLLSAIKESGATTISITNSPTLVAARQAEFNLVAPSKTPSGYPTFDTLMGLLSILWQALILLDEEKAHQGVTATVNAITKLSAQHDKVPAYDIASLLRLWGQK